MNIREIERKGSGWRAAATSCIHGHDLADSYIREDGSRQCRLCRNRRVKAWRDKMKGKG